MLCIQNLLCILKSFILQIWKNKIYFDSGHPAKCTELEIIVFSFKDMYKINQGMLWMKVRVDCIGNDS